MKNNVRNLLSKLQLNTTSFAEVISFIEEHYEHRPTAFKNGALQNDPNQNQGSAKVFSFAQKNDFTAEATLYLFAEHYQAVLGTPEGTDHQNIRQFMIHGWDGIGFAGEALVKRS